MKKKLKKILFKILPAPVKVWHEKRRFDPERFKGMNVQEVFTDIYKTNHWHSSESISGPGSELKQTAVLINALNILLAEKDIRSILDIPCGDFNWMRNVEMKNISYIGADIVEELIRENQRKYSTDTVHFDVLNLITDKLPKADIIIVRDCLVHLPFESIYHSIRNIKSSGSTYLLTTTFPEHSVNYDVRTGEWRPLNLQLKPFNFPEPLLIINEGFADVEFKDKSMALWEIDKIAIPAVPYME